jgi:hypothetical protein
MASIFFGNKLDMIIAATPSSGSYLVAYDLDGILKQKDEFGVINTIGAQGFQGATGSEEYTYATFSLSPSDILTMGGTAIGLLPQSGTNSYYDIQKVILEYTFGTTGYTFFDINNEKITILSDTIPLFVIDCRLISNQDSPLSGDRVVLLTNSPVTGATQSGSFVSFFYPINKNSEIKLSTLGGTDPENGDGSLFLKIWYKVNTFG